MYPPCAHDQGFSFYPHGKSIRWRCSTPQRLSAARPSTDSSSNDKSDRRTFPEPLALPGDALDSDHFDIEADEAQSFADWLSEEDRNTVSPRRKTIYVGAPPRINSSVSFVDKWRSPHIGSDSEETYVEPRIEDVMRYLAAFYWPLPVKELEKFEFTKWDAEDAETSESKPQEKASKRKGKGGIRNSASTPYVALHELASGNATRISTRSAPRDQLYSRQISTNDMIDALIESLPKDAYAAVLLVEHDLYEDEDDDFIIGRAYGGSRVAVVSMARYNPVLDAAQGIDRQHSWPLSHCTEFVRSKGGRVSKSRTDQVGTHQESISNKPILAAIASVVAQSHYSANDADEMNKLWLNRVCRTVSHELGHCFGLDHCLYYACIMQASSNTAEDVRQPGYLCPVDISKLLEATGSTGKEMQWCAKMAEACERLGPGGGFGALEAWMRARIRQLAARSRDINPIEVVVID